MIFKNVTMREMDQAMTEINKKYVGNIRFKKIEPVGRRIRATLTVHNSAGKGGKRSPDGRRVAAACWHVHGDFFDALTAINPEAVIETCQSVINRNGGNWQDFNIGSLYRPFMASEGCLCGQEG